MAHVEGCGRRAPVGKSVTLTAAELEELRSLGRHRANFRGYEQRKDRWGQGFSVDAVLLGMIGELAMAKFTNAFLGSDVLKIDTVDRRQGDPGYDFKIGGITIDVKASRTNGRPLLVRRVNDYGRIMSLRADAYVLVDAQEHTKPRLVGFAWAKHMHRFARSRATGSRHFNIIVPREELQPIGRLIAVLEAEKIKRGFQ